MVYRIIKCDASGVDSGGEPKFSYAELNTLPKDISKSSDDEKGVVKSIDCQFVDISNFEIDDGDELLVFCVFGDYGNTPLSLYDNLSIGFFYPNNLPVSTNGKDEVMNKVDYPNGMGNSGRNSASDIETYSLVNVNSYGDYFNVSRTGCNYPFYFSVVDMYDCKISRNGEAGKIIWAWELQFIFGQNQSNNGVADFELFVDFGDPHRGATSIRCKPRQSKAMYG